MKSKKSKQTNRLTIKEWFILAGFLVVYFFFMKSKDIILNYPYWLLGLVFIIVLAIIIAVRCNPDNKVAYAFIAMLFSEIYLIQFFIRKYIIQEKNYCSGIFQKILIKY